MVATSFSGLKWKPMASGHLCLELTDRIGWHEFPKFAERLVSDFGWNVVEKSVVADMHIWGLKFENEQIRLVFDDFPLMISLESDSHKGDEIIKSLALKLTDATVN